MANQYINIYQGNPTEGGIDGTCVSEGDASEPINVTLDADNNETKTFKLAVRCVEGYHSVGDVVISDNSNRWSFSLAEDGAFADSITVSAVDSVNSIFWAKASCTEADSPSTDTAVAISVHASVRSTDSTVVLMHFDQPDVLKDECGNQWSGSNDLGYELVKVEEEWGCYYDRDSSRPCTGVWGNAYLFTQSDWIYTEDIPFGGQDFTIDFWFKLDTSNLDEWFEDYGFCFPTFEIGFSFTDANGETYPFLITDQSPVTVYFGSEWGNGECTWVRNRYYPDFESIEDVQSYAVWHHYAFVYIHEQRTVRAFVDGQLSFIEVLNDPINRSVGEIELGPYDPEHCYMDGYFDELRVVDGVAVWTEDFTPPDQPYSLSQTVNVALLCDTAITITKTEAEPVEKDHISVIELYDIHLRTGTVYVCNVDVDITFEGNKYLAIPIAREDISRSVDNVDDDMKITMADAATDQLKFIIAGFDFRGCFVRVRQIIYPDSLDDNSIFRDCFYGYIDNPAYENGEFSCTLRSRIPKVTVPRRTYQAMCNCRFGDAVCQMDQSRSTGKIVDVLGDNRIVIDRIHDEHFWVNGIITIEGESRMIRLSEGAVITTYYPFFAAIGRGLNYTIRRGCDKTFETCQRLGNLQHFAGFPSIPFETIYR